MHEGTKLRSGVIQRKRERKERKKGSGGQRIANDYLRMANGRRGKR